MKFVVWALVVLLIVLHQDNWNWDNDKLIAGFMPITLLYHVCISAAAAVAWFLAAKFAWPVEVDESSSERGADA